jgi:hypothetical protein
MEESHRGYSQKPGHHCFGINFVKPAKQMHS